MLVKNRENPFTEWDKSVAEWFGENAEKSVAEWFVIIAFFL